MLPNQDMDSSCELPAVVLWFHSASLIPKRVWIISALPPVICKSVWKVDTCLTVNRFTSIKPNRPIPKVQHLQPKKAAALIPLTAAAVAKNPALQVIVVAAAVKARPNRPSLQKIRGPGFAFNHRWVWHLYQQSSLIWSRKLLPASQPMNTGQVTGVQL